MDLPDVSEADFSEALEDLAFSNRWLGGHAASMGLLAGLVRRAALDGARPVLVLDVASGGGDLALALAAEARRSHLELRVLTSDSCVHAVRFAQRAAAAEPLIQVVRADARALPIADHGVHVVHAAQFLHHVPRAEQAGVLRSLARVASVGGVVSDLRRTAFGYHGVRLFGWATHRGRLFRHDGPVSVARAFTLCEAQSLAQESAIAGIRVQSQRFSRLTWDWGPLPVTS